MTQEKCSKPEPRGRACEGPGSLAGLFGDPELEADQERAQIVVRLRRSYWHDHNGAYQRMTLRYLKRHTKGFNVFDDDCSIVGAEDVIPKITNLEKCEDGIYKLVICNTRRDWETGHVEEWDYQLVPLSPNTTIIHERDK